MIGAQGTGQDPMTQTQYNDNMIRIRFVTGSDWLSEAIRFGERDGWCTHAEAVMPDGTLLGAHLSGGVQKRLPGYDYATKTRELVVVLDGTRPISGPVTADTPTVGAAFYAFLNSQVGKPYDTTAIAGLALNRDWRKNDSWFCSELQAAALEHCGFLPHLAATDNHISPRDLLLILSGIVEIPDAQ